LAVSRLDNESELLKDISFGNEKSFRLVFDHYWKSVYGVAYVLTKSIELSEEIVQDVFLKIWLNRERLPEIEKFDGYLFMAARNHIYNVLRKKVIEGPWVAQLEQHFLETSSLPEEQLLLKETTEAIKAAVAKLPQQQRTVFELSRFEGLDHAKIADQLGISKLTVKSHMTKALQTIRFYLQSHTDALLFISCMLYVF
jgi:RNA polymerase sigma-70 factor (family 1)